MNLRKLILTNNACYKAGRKIKPKGIMVHSTGANNPNLKRYVGPDDGLLGKNQYNNHWNQDKPGGRQVCVHAFIGKLADGTIATYQTLPWDHRGWHAGGDANNTHIGFEICEDNHTDAAYFNKVYKEAVELCVHLCKLYNLTEKDIIGHYEGHQQGIASNHGDPRHWFGKHGRSMDGFRADVKSKLNPPKKQNTEFYRVRKSWDNPKSQLNAYINLQYAINLVDKNKGYKVFDEQGEQVYPKATKEPTKASNEFLTRVTANALNVRSGPSTKYRVNTVIRDKGTYTIVDTNGKWGKLKSGAGWIHLDYTKKL